MTPRFLFYRLLSALLPRRFQQHLGSAGWTRPFRDWLFRESTSPRVVLGDVGFEGESFSWAAPLQVLAKAQDRGVENRICRAIRANGKEGDVFIDVGTNYGFLSMIMSRTAGTRGTVIGIEADQGACRVLRETLQRNGASNMHLHHAKAGRKDDPASDTVTLVSLATQHAVDRVDLIKIDVDGPDFGVLEGAQQLLLDHHPLVIIEMTRQQNQIFDLLVSCGYNTFIGMSGETIAAGGPWPENLFAWTGPIAGLPEPDP